MIKAPFEIKRNQLLSAIGCIALMIGFIFLVMYVILPKDDLKNSNLSYNSEFTSASSRIDPESVWRQKIEMETKEMSKKLELLEKMLKETLEIKTQEAVQDSDISQLRQQIQDLQTQPPPQVHQSAESGPSLPHPPGFYNRSYEDSSSPRDLNAQHGIKKITLNLIDNKKHKIKKTVDNTIPAGAFAQAILLGGVDASTSIQASSDPRPVLLRVMNKGTLPRRFQSDLLDCHVLASSYGDLSSERVYTRLEKLTCTETQTGEISETIVAGYIAGEDGKAGLRGVLVDKSGELLRHSFAAGFLGGMGQFLSTVNTPSSTFTLGPTGPQAQLGQPSYEQLLKGGLGKGASNALERYADFYIKRAEQLQPVLQIAAGRHVDIVFTEGTKFGQTHAKKMISKVRNKARLKAAKGFESAPASNSLTLREKTS